MIKDQFLMCVPNNTASTCIRQNGTEPLEKKDEWKIIVRVFNTSQSEVDRSSLQEISKHIFELNSTINQQNIIEIY